MGITAREAAAKLDVNVGTVCRLCRHGALKAEKYTVPGSGTSANQWVIEPESLETFAETYEKPSTSVNNDFGRKVEASAVVVKKQAEIDKLLNRADKLVQARLNLIRELFPNPQPGQVKDFVLDHMAPNGRTCVATYDVRKFRE